MKTRWDLLFLWPTTLSTYKGCSMTAETFQKCQSQRRKTGLKRNVLKMFAYPLCHFPSNPVPSSSLWLSHSCFQTSSLNPSIFNWVPSILPSLVCFWPCWVHVRHELNRKPYYFPHFSGIKSFFLLCSAIICNKFHGTEHNVTALFFKVALQT